MSTTGKPKTKLGYGQYVLFPDDGKRHEVMDGDHYMNPAPGTYHQTISRRIQFALYVDIELKGLGVVFDAPVDVQLGDHDIVQPDIVVVLSNSTAQVTPSRILGAPDLLVEIISPSTARNDRDLKRAIYEKAGVREYWIVDPESHSVDQLVLTDGVYVSQPHDGDVRLAVSSGLQVSFDSVW